jgi:hypothetical protein
MSCDIEIHIFGKPMDVEAIWDLANVAADQATINFSQGFENYEFLGMMEKAAEQGKALTLTVGDTSDLADELTCACSEAGLPYVVHYSETGTEEYTHGLAWTPGMSKDFEFVLDRGKPALALAKIQRAASQGIDAVNALLAEVALVTTPGAIEMDTGFKDSMKEFLDSGEAIGYSA